ncbi:MAG: RecX family transcriptional regulator [Proteobacteria bacterium]|nr:RecX family transcriptional regulator [Pseudomonadota bacterium]
MKERNTVSQVREESSSSQNVNLYITGISGRGSSDSGFRVGLSDGSSFFVSKTFFNENGLEINLVVDSELLNKIEIESESIKAVLKAADLISRSEQSSGGLYVKLKRKGFCDSAAADAVSLVKSEGLLDDDRFAEMWIASRLRKHPEGRSMIYSGLCSRGVPADIAGYAVEKYISEEDILDAVDRAGRKLSLKHKNNNLKLKAALFRRGFSNREIQFFLDNDNV